MKRKVNIIMALAVCISILFGMNTLTLAASWPGLSSSAYCEFTAPKQINVYMNSSCTTRGTSSPSKAYNAYISPNDVCKILNISSSYIQLSYPTSSGYKTGYIKRSDLFGVSSPTESFISAGKVTTYITPDGRTYGNTAKGDNIYACGTSSGYTAIIYSARSGQRAYKFGYVKTSDYQSVLKGSTSTSTSTSSSTLLFPIRGSITTSSGSTTNGYYCDYGTGGSVPVYAPADGTVEFRQSYAINYGKLASYANHIVFTSSDKKYVVKCAHLSKFNGVTPKYITSLSYPCSSKNYKCDTITLASRKVKKGDLLGYTGMTGNASGHHLHLEVYKNGNAVNPKSVFTTW